MYGLCSTFPPKSDLNLKKSYCRLLFGLGLEKPKSIYHLIAKSLEATDYDLWGHRNTQSSVSKAVEATAQHGCWYSITVYLLICEHWLLKHSALMFDR